MIKSIFYKKILEKAVHPIFQANTLQILGQSFAKNGLIIFRVPKNGLLPWGRNLNVFGVVHKFPKNGQLHTY